MKNLALAVMLSLTSAATLAQEGYHILGSVVVPDGGDEMHASFNVRFSPKPGHETSYAYTSYFADGPVRFAGWDALNENAFVCDVQTDDPLYGSAIDVANAWGDGARISVARDLASNECTFIRLTKHSAYQQ